jgi:hypothetical protein
LVACEQARVLRSALRSRRWRRSARTKRGVVREESGG